MIENSNPFFLPHGSKWLSQIYSVLSRSNLLASVELTPNRCASILIATSLVDYTYTLHTTRISTRNLKPNDCRLATHDTHVPSSYKSVSMLLTYTMWLQQIDYRIGWIMDPRTEIAGLDLGQTGNTIRTTLRAKFLCHTPFLKKSCFIALFP